MSELPFWYNAAIAEPSEYATVKVDGVDIAYTTWGEIGKPGIVLIHGSNAHMEWWRFTAPFLADNFRIAALDLSGNGNSGWRERYSGGGFAQEVWAGCQTAELGPKPIVVGHSFGGFAALEAAHYFGDQMTGVLFMDFTVAPEADYIEWGRRVEREGVEAGRKLRVYKDKDTALGRFRFIPEQPGVHPEVLRHLGNYGLKEVDGGWTWKFDPGIFDYIEMGSDQEEKFRNISCKTGLMLGEQSEDEGALYGQQMIAMTNGKMPSITVPGTYHHLMFDQPIAVAMAMKILFLEWLR